MAGMGLSEGMQSVSKDLMADPAALRSRILEALYLDCDDSSIFQAENGAGAASSSVMLLLGEQPAGTGSPASAGHRGVEIALILNKRSRRVRQAGDLCCPGGAVEPQLDPYLAKLLLLPGSPLARWPHWSQYQNRECRESARLLALLLATGLRESWEEMRLNPLSIALLGTLPPQRLLLFRRIIHPMVGWVKWRQRFVPSWEVEKIVRIPLRTLLDPAHYACYRLHVPPRLEQRFNHHTQDMPCFLYQDGRQTEMLWGATYKIVMSFLARVFGFTPPEPGALPLVPGILDESYIYGRDD